jgi:uncharacterized protein (UPF0335 family)
MRAQLDLKALALETSRDQASVIFSENRHHPRIKSEGRLFGIMFHREEYAMATAAAVKDEQTAHRFAKDQLKAFVERVEKLEEEKKTIADDIRDVYAEAKGNGFDVKALRVVVRMRKQDVNERKEQEAILETYLHALGMLN